MPKGASDRPLLSKQRAPIYTHGEGSSMPLHKGKSASTKEGFSDNVKTEMAAGKPQDQSVAIAYSEARRGKKGHSSHSNKTHRHKEHR